MLWQKSPQYSGMPHEQYMQTDEGKRAGQAFDQWNAWMRRGNPSGGGLPGVIVNANQAAPGSSKAPASGGVAMPTYRPSQAQPKQPVSSGTPYSAWSPSGGSPNSVRTIQPATMGSGNVPARMPAPTPDSGAISPQPGQQSGPYFGDGQIRRTPGGYWQGDMFVDETAFPSSPPAPRPPAQFTTGDPSGEGNLAYAAPDKRPAAFSKSIIGFDGQRYDDPSAYYRQRDAFIQRLNDERGKLSAMSGPSAPPGMTPNRDFRALWGQAGDMAKDGWTNPLAGLFG